MQEQQSTVNRENGKKDVSPRPPSFLMADYTKTNFFQVLW